MLLRPVDPKLYHKEPVAADAALSLRYLGTAGFVLEGQGHTMVLDPYVSRPRLLQMFRPLVPDTALIDEVIPHTDDVLVGHAHFDHILDAPHLCHRDGARLIGSPSVCQVGRAAGLPETQLVVTSGREKIPSGPATIYGVPSLHGKIFGRIPLPGVIESPPSWPPKYKELRCGIVLNWHIEWAGIRVVHIDSADVIDEELDGLQADVVCLCAVGRQSRPQLVSTVVGKLKPKIVVACHWDWFFSPYKKKPLCLPGVDLPGFCQEVKEAGAAPVILPFDGRLGLSVRS